LQQQWCVPRSEVKVLEGEEHVLGRGSYGEVRVAIWRGTRVAAKALHALQPGVSKLVDQLHNMHDSLLQEMELLGSLRHPNLLLFLGVTYDPATLAPQSILTELMPCSLYDIIQKLHICLSKSEILDIAEGISSGLVYLHGHCPHPIVHRDLSCKNVLYDGRRVKIADLGQAKVLGVRGISGSRQQTAMPGAMAYAAPECLTGRYSSEIDLFSFGVLLVHMVTGEYPRIDRREDQVGHAGQKFRKLKPLICRCLSLHAEDRPTASQAQRSLQDLKHDLGLYSPHGHGGGVLVERWVREELKETTRDLQQQVLVYEKRLAAEMGRWRTEADRADQLTETMQQHVDAAARAKEGQERMKEEMERSCNRLGKVMKDQEALKGELAEQLDTELRDMDALRLATDRKMQQALSLCAAAEQSEKEAGEKAEAATLSMLAAVERAEALEKKLATQASLGICGCLEATKEAEVRTAQSIVRWEEEKTTRLKHQKLFFAQVSDMTHLQTHVKDLEHQLSQARQDLARYHEMPVPELMRDKVLGMERDIEREQDKSAELSSKLVERDRRYEELQAAKGDIEELLRQSEAKASEAEAAAAQARAEKADAEAQEKKAAQREKKWAQRVEQGCARIKAVTDEMDELKAFLAKLKEESPFLFTGSKSLANGNSPNLASSPEVPDIKGELEHERCCKTRLQMLQRASSIPPGSNCNPDSSLFNDMVRFPLLPVRAVSQAKDCLEVLDAMKKHPANTSMQWRGLRAIGNALAAGTGNSAELAEAGAVGLALSLLQVRPGTSHVIAVRALGHLVFGSDSNRELAGESGGVVAVLDSMRQRPAHQELQCHGCLALTNLLHNSKANRHRAREAGCIGVILDAMQAFLGSHKLQRNACWALLTLAASDEASVDIAAEGGVGAIIAGMINCGDNADVLHYACWALVNIAWSQGEVRRFCKSEGAPAIIAEAMASFPRHAGLLEKGELALQLLLGGARSEQPQVTGGQGAGGKGDQVELAGPAWSSNHNKVVTMH
ncbi:unnamed protein product, partial [Chrysoparadoxa australica]